MAIVEGSGGAKTTKKNTANIFDNINKQIEAQKNNLNTTGSVYSSQGNTGYANENAKSKVLENTQSNNIGNKISDLKKYNTNVYTYDQKAKDETEKRYNEAKNGQLDQNKVNELNNRFSVIIDSNNKVVDQNKYQVDVEKYNTTAQKIINDMNELSGEYKKGRIVQGLYELKQNELKTKFDQNELKGNELRNYQVKQGFDYYDWAKENNVDVSDFEKYTESLDDIYLEKLGSLYAASVVDTANTIPQTFEILKSIATGGDYNAIDENNVSSKLSSLSNELREYGYSGTNGAKRWSLQTIESLMPMINAMLIGKGVTSGTTSAVNTFSNVFLGTQTAGQVTKQRLQEGNDLTTSVINGALHGTITGLVEAMDAGKIASVFTGDAEKFLLSNALFSKASFSQVAGYLNSIGASEGTEEIVEGIADYIADSLQNEIMGAINGETANKINVEKLDANELASQFVMAYAGAVLLGVPVGGRVVINSKQKYNAAIQARNSFQSTIDSPLASIQEKKLAEKSIQVIDEDLTTYKKNSLFGDAITSTADDVAPSPTYNELMNNLANAIQQDVQGELKTAKQTLDNAQNLKNMIDNELRSRGFLNNKLETNDIRGVSTDTYLKMSQDMKNETKDLLNLSNAIGADVKVDDNFNVWQNGKLVNTVLGNEYNGANANKGNIALNPFSNNVKKNGSGILKSTLAHELTHNIKDLTKLKELVKNNLGDEGWALEENYVRNAWGDDVNTQDDIDEEIVARYIENNFGNEKFLRTIANYDSSIITRLFNNFKALVDVTGKSEIANEFFKAFEESKNIGITESGFAYNKSNSFENIIDNIKDVTKIGLNPSNLISIRESTPKLLLDTIPNINNYPMLIELGKLKSALGFESSRRNTHHVSDTFIKNLPKVLENPDVIYYHSGQHSYNLICYDNGVPIIISIKPNLKGKYFNVDIDTNKVSTIFDVNYEINDYFEKSISKVLYPNINKKEVISRVNANTASKVDTPSNIRLTNNNDNVNNTKFSKSLSNETDNENSQLSNGQVEYFKDSKLRDDNGKLVKLYHTSKKLFTEFNPVGSERYRFGNNVVNYYSTNKDVSGSYNRGKYNQVNNDTFIDDINVEETAKKLKKQIDDTKKLKDIAWDKFNGAAIHYFDKYGYDFNDLYGNLKYLPLESFTNNLKGDKDLAEGSKYIMSIVENLSRVNNADENLNVDAFVESSTRVLEVYEKMVGDNNYNIEDRYGKETSEYLLSNKTKELFENVKADLKNIWQLGDEHSDLRTQLTTLNMKYDKLLSNGYQYSGYGLSTKPYTIDGNLSNWNSLNNSNYYLDTNEINNVASEVVDIIGNITDTEILDAKWKVNDYILKNVSDNTKQYLIDNPIVLANLSNYAKDLYSTRNYSFGKNLKERMIEKIGYQFESNAGVRQVGSDRYNITKFGDNLETNDVVKAVIAINQYLESQGNDAKYDGVVFNNIYDTGSSFDVKANVPSDVVALFNSNQFKSDFNLTPTSKSDIRFSKNISNKVYRGGPVRINGVNFFTDDLSTARSFGQTDEYNISMKNPLVVDANYSDWNQIKFKPENLDIGQYTTDYYFDDIDNDVRQEIIDNIGGLNDDEIITNTNALVEIAKLNGFDGLIIKNVDEIGTGNRYVTSYAVFDDKSVKPIAYNNVSFSKNDNKINVYHGTPNDFENYDMSLSGTNTNNHSGEKGVIWFTNDKDVAKQYSYEQTPTNSMFVNNVGKQGTVREETITLNNPVDLRNLTNEQAQIIADNDDFNYSVEQLIEESKAPNSQLIKTHINENTINALKAAGYDGFVNEYDPTKYPNVLEYGVFDIKQISNNKANKKVNYDKQLVDLLSNPYGNDELREYLKNKYNKSDENIEKAIILRDSLNVSNNDQLDYEKSLQKLSREIVDNKTVVKGLTDEQIADFNKLTPTNKYTSGLSTEDSKVVTKARKMIKQQMVDKSRRLNVKNELNQVVADIYQTGDITEQTYNSLREKIVDSTLIKVPNDEYGIKTDIINNYMNGTPFLKKDGWDNTIQEIQDKYNVFAQDNYPLTYEDAKNSLKDFFDSIGDRYIYYTPVQMGMMSQGDYDNMLINTVADVINELKFNINNVDMDDKALVEFTNERLSSKEANLIDKLLINDALGNNDYVNNVLDYIRRNNTNQEVMEGAISSSEDSLQDLIKNESKYIDTIVEKDGIASLPIETLDKMEADSLEYITLDKVKDQETKVLENQKYKKKGTNLKEDINKMKQKIIDRGQAIYDLGRKTKSDIYAYYNNYRNAASMADYKLYQDKNNWVDIIKKIPKDQQNDFSYMMYHWLNTDTYKYKKPVFGDITDKQSQQIVDQYLKEHPDWKDVAQKVWDYEKDLREELVKHGRISRQTADTWEEMYPHYVHIVRDSVNVEEVPNVLETEQEKVKSSNKGTVKERTGGNSALKSLNDAIVEQTKQVYSATTMNDFINRYVQVAKPKVQVWEDFQDRTIEGIDRSIGNEIQAPDENTPATFIFYDNGDTRTIEVPANIYDAFVAEKVMDNVVTDVLSKANEIRRNLITSQNITFAARNIIKDTQDVLLKSEHPTLTYTMMPKAAVDMATNSETYQLYRSMGGGRNNATKVTEGSKIYNKTIGMVERGNNFVETLPRYAEFKASLASGRTPIQAMYDADKVTTNFKMGGDYTKFADRNGFTFLNSSVEGFTELARDYQSVYDKKGWKGVLGKLAMATLVFNVPLMVANHLRWKDDEDYQNLSDYVKDNYYILWKNSDGSFTRINKGRVAAAYQAVISTLWENGVELVSDDSATEKAKFMWENSLDGLERVWDNIGINNPLKNNIVSPIIDVMKNETWYGEDLLSEYQLKKDASEQYDYTTDALSKWIGQNTNTSPIKWNYLLEQYSGGIGDIVLPTLTPKAETDLDDGTALGKVESALLSPIIDDFTVDPVFKNQNVSDLFDLDTELSKRASKDSATDEEKIASKYISNIKYQMFKLYGERADIFNDETLTDAEKYRQARLIQGQINELAKYGLNTYDNIDMSGGYTQVGDLSYYKNSQNEWEKVNADTIEEMESLGMTTDQRNTYYQLKEEITGNNQVQTLLGYYDSLEEFKNSNKYSSTMKKNKISELEEKIKKAESKFTSEELAQIKKDGTINARTNNYEAIKSSNLSDEQKNYMYDKYYSSNLNEYINELDISDSEKLDLKYTTSQVEGKKNAKGKTISNSKALAMADAYADAGVLDDVFAYIKENNLDPSDFGLSKKVYNYSYKQLENAYKNIFGQDFGTGDTIEDTSVIDSSYYGTSGTSSSSTDKARKKQLKAMKAYMNAITSANKNIFSYLNNMTSIEDAKSNVEKIKSKYKV